MNNSQQQSNGLDQFSNVITLDQLIDMLQKHRDKTYGGQPVLFKMAMPASGYDLTRQGFFTESTDVFMTPASVIDYHGSHARILGYRCEGRIKYNSDDEGKQIKVVTIK